MPLSGWEGFGEPIHTNSSEEVMKECEICYAETMNRKPTESQLAPFSTPKPLLLCNQCRNYAAYWNGLSPEDRQAEEVSMAAYADER